ncbi:MTAP family purine nucleoside phosphorylase [bacterium]|nr:MTAP family purine nucleoside phosphorylase [bacterium]
MDIAVIGGTGIDEIMEVNSMSTLTTRFGQAQIIYGRLNGIDLLFVPRHGSDHSVPPSMIDYRAQIAAIRKLGVTRVIGICAVGSLKKNLPPGSFAILGDFIDLTRKRVDTFFDDPEGPVVHTDFTLPYCPEMSEALSMACGQAGVEFVSGAVYAGVEGPRYESPAEIRLYASWGAHVIGMTNIPEVILAKEAGLCYGAMGVVTNMASGISPTPLSHDEVREAMTSASKKLADVLRIALENIPVERACTCASNKALVF